MAGTSKSKLVSRKLKAAVPETRNYVYESHRMSLLEAIEERHENTKKHTIHRLVCIGRYINVDNPQEFADKISNELNSILQRKHGVGEELTGILLLYNEHFIHIVEGLYDQLFVIIDNLADPEKKSDLSVVLTKIVALVHNTPNRNFSAWNWLSVHIHRNEELDKSKPVAIVAEFLDRLLNLAIFMMSHTLKELQEAIDSLVESVREYFPSEVAVQCLLELPLQSAEEFITFYKPAANIILDDEIVWPTVVNAFPLS